MVLRVAGGLLVDGVGTWFVFKLGGTQAGGLVVGTGAGAGDELHLHVLGGSTGFETCGRNWAVVGIILLVRIVSPDFSSMYFLHSDSELNFLNTAPENPCVCSLHSSLKIRYFVK